MNVKEKVSKKVSFKYKTVNYKLWLKIFTIISLIVNVTLITYWVADDFGFYHNESLHTWLSISTVFFTIVSTILVGGMVLSYDDVYESITHESIKLIEGYVLKENNKYCDILVGKRLYEVDKNDIITEL